ncbi:Mfa1 fimbrilin [Bacteroides coprosuis DSM 18011]|uniref:Mfa1 fimbrilin n=1 Tax=Bacteroides coprosuis DSM 18011 TaxID=679937 RepID=F3ZR25_9BACE|nr:Mfa1 family fimbria major subunit [Bacteroides coprosuis]EGJ71898.1 Mfa1 fimbrilin [Bacteroides coprosuis DSM 18011]
MKKLRIQTVILSAGISISVPGAASTRASLKHVWSGRDKIESVHVFLVNNEKVDYTRFDTSSFKIKEGILTFNKAVVATAGDIKAYVVLNATKDLAKKLIKSNAANFDDKFEEEIKKLASEISKSDKGEDLILMTNAKVSSLTIAPKVSQDKAISGVGNQIQVEVERVVARAIMTQSAAIASKIDVKNSKGDSVSQIEVTKLTYAVGLSNNSFFGMKKSSNLETPNYTYIPVNTPWNTEVVKIYDFSGLKQFTEVSKIESSVADKDSIKKALEEEAVSKFVLPVTHGEADYRKGNTTYFEVRAKFKPSAALADTEAKYTEGSDLFLGMTDGKFYADEKAAINAVKGGQKVRAYREGVMKYVLWLNPNVTPGSEVDQTKTKTSPTVRNQVYHVHITGFKEIGLPYNPLDPNEPTKPGTEDPGNPIDPTDPLELDKTYLSVKISVLDWGLNSYNMDLGNDY